MTWTWMGRELIANEVTGYDYSFNSPGDMDGLDSMTLPQIVSYLSDWSSILSHQEGFPELVLEASKEVERSKG